MTDETNHAQESRRDPALFSGRDWLGRWHHIPKDNEGRDHALFTLFDWLCRVLASAAVVLEGIRSGVSRRCQHQLAAHKTEASNAVSRDKNRRGNGSDGICFTSPALSLATVSKGESASERDVTLSQLLLTGSSATLRNHNNSLETFQWLHKLLRVWKILQTV